MPEHQRHEVDADGAVISRTTILILSSFLVGVSVGKGGADSISPYALAAAFAGILAFIAFDFAAARRRELVQSNRLDQVTSRLDKHVTPSGDEAPPAHNERPAERETVATA
ncbi:MAG: hypothetical protein DWQ34_22545 [Planctomycetota bacterium]|nr:MAG: hypothetical protein DWQ29_10395 [Planctomycetota bacterium]REJ88370.1 MAG: hypothetical protein DWQ34_22545 [Planctomycetota bacterium]REK30668.1 MAG: hypothetical protein DWQ41_01600 [Planctomycetota bacterium]REK33042.1 MAG: hypothetical protein DWQ45_15700 [Planctomycetota bacterium]